MKIIPGALALPSSGEHSAKDDQNLTGDALGQAISRFHPAPEMRAGLIVASREPLFCRNFLRRAEVCAFCHCFHMQRNLQAFADSTIDVCLEA